MTIPNCFASLAPRHRDSTTLMSLSRSLARSHNEKYSPPPRQIRENIPPDIEHTRVRGPGRIARLGISKDTKLGGKSKPAKINVESSQRTASFKTPNHIDSSQQPRRLSCSIIDTKNRKKETHKLLSL
jgi:hypothetical protein